MNHLIEQESVRETLTEKELTILVSLDDYFGSLYRSTITLFQTISDGVTWDEPADALTSIWRCGLLLGPVVSLLHCFLQLGSAILWLFFRFLKAS